MPIRPLLSLAALACAAGCAGRLASRPPGQGPFGSAISLSSGLLPGLWPLLQGIILGLGLGWLLSRLAWGSGQDNELSRLRSALDLVEGLLKGWQRKDKVASLRRWLRRGKP